MSLPIPSWAQGPIESFKKSQTLPGASKQAIPADQVADVSQSIRTNVDEIVAQDGSDADAFKTIPKKLGMDMFGASLQAEWTGDTRSGVFVESLQDGEQPDRGAFIYAEFTPQSATMVMLSNEGGQVTGTARHADLARPDQSFELVNEFQVAR